MHMRSTVVCASAIFVTVSILSAAESNARTGLVISDSVGSTYDEWSEKEEKGKTGKFAGVHYYWKDGLHIDSRNKIIRIKAGGKLAIDGGDINANDDLETAFPDLEGRDIRLRKIELDVSGSLHNRVKFQFQLDLGNPSEIKDNWVDIGKIPMIGHIRLGHMKEPFSLEELTGFSDKTFMEKSSPTEAFAPGRNLGVMLHDTVAHKRMTWAVGGFWQTGSFNDLENPEDRIESATGFNVTTRVTALPRWSEDGGKLLHLGASFTHQLRERVKDDSTVQFRARPESHLTSDRLVDTGELSADYVNMINPEFAMSFGSFSLQGESFHAFVDADAGGVGKFWGFYLYGSYFITGEHRSYNRSGGVFSEITPVHDFSLAGGGWGAWELGFRYSYIDLNDGKIRGGKENNFSVGVNGYLNPNARIMFNYIHVNVEDRVSPAIDDGRANILQARFQIAF